MAGEREEWRSVGPKNERNALGTKMGKKRCPKKEREDWRERKAERREANQRKRGKRWQRKLQTECACVHVCMYVCVCVRVCACLNVSMVSVSISISPLPSFMYVSCLDQHLCAFFCFPCPCHPAPRGAGLFLSSAYEGLTCSRILRS